MREETYYEDEDGVLRGKCKDHGDFIGDAIGCPECFSEDMEIENREEEEKK